ncbi:MAG: class I SAM-dependent methyltransferase [Acidobacteriaceae bacterium]|nr:class I SAM-dependent methyltransferase [Acidobacteriaceae bacterium]MBV9764523.1 class I SAM-dependent methyltransferase [Acidobacteriaceae bacterium]
MDQRKTYLSSEAISNYINRVGVTEPDILRRLREETASHPQAQMQITPEQGQFFRVLLGAIGAKKTLEVGVFTGYSSIVAAMALPAGGRVVACDTSEEFTSIARRYWREAGIEDKIELRLGPAIQTLETLLNEGGAKTFDFAFIDAEKSEYDQYYELALKLLRPGGLIAIDNTLWHGRVLDDENQEAGVPEIRALNEKIHGDSRVESVLLPIADGVTLARKL